MTNSEKSKRYYWFKTTEELLNGPVRALFKNKNGLGGRAWGLYCQLVLMAANSNGALIQSESEGGGPLTIPQIAEKSFSCNSLNEVKTCLKMLIRANLVAKNGRLYSIANIDKLVGITTKGAIEKANQRNVNKALEKAQERAKTAVSLLESDEVIEQQALRLTNYVYQVRFIRSMTNQDTTDTLHKELKTLVGYYGMAMVENALKYVIQTSTERDDNGIVVHHRIKAFGYKSEVNYLIKSIYGQCEKRAT